MIKFPLAFRGKYENALESVAHYKRKFELEQQKTADLRADLLEAQRNDMPRDPKGRWKKKKW